MAGRKTTAGSRRAVDVDTERPAFVVHQIDHVRAVLAAAVQSGRPVTLVTPPGGGAYLGLPYLAEMISAASADYPAADYTAVLDAGDDAAVTHAALSSGWHLVVFQGADAMRDKLTDIAKQTESCVLDAPPDAIDLQTGADPVEAAKEFLAGH